MFLSKPLGNFTEFIDISFSINFSSKNKVFFLQEINLFQNKNLIKYPV